jgi:hypothetical protein
MFLPFIKVAIYSHLNADSVLLRKNNSIKLYMILTTIILLGRLSIMIPSPPSPYEEEGVYRFANVGRSVD